MAKFEGGYDLSFVDIPPSDLKCLICHCIARDAHQATCCGKVFCKGCLEEVENCPLCRKSVTPMRDTKIQQQIGSLKVRCVNLSNDCTWVSELRYHDEHTQECGYQQVNCTFECEEKILKKDLDRHTKEECPKRPYTCPKCGEKGEHAAMLDHETKCKVVCPNRMCHRKILYRNLEKHRSTCKFERILCKDSEIGCEERPMRKDLEEHENDDQLHLHNAKATVVQQNKKIKLLEEENHRMKDGQPNSKSTFKVPNFTEYRSTSTPFPSRSIKSSSNGYRFCIDIDATDSEHVSVYACLMKGENDQFLTWPFTGTVTFELLNQLDDRNHHSYTTPGFPAEKGQRVTEGDKDEQGWGSREYIPHADLDYNPTKNCQYLKDDTLIFRVSVNVPDYKSWLECNI